MWSSMNNNTRARTLADASTEPLDAACLASASTSATPGRKQKVDPSAFSILVFEVVPDCSWKSNESFAVNLFNTSMQVRMPQLFTGSTPQHPSLRYFPRSILSNTSTCFQFILGGCPYEIACQQVCLSFFIKDWILQAPLLPPAFSFPISLTRNWPPSSPKAVGDTTHLQPFLRTCTFDERSESCPARSCFSSPWSDELLQWCPMGLEPIYDRTNMKQQQQQNDLAKTGRSKLTHQTATFGSDISQDSPGCTT